MQMTVNVAGQVGQIRLSTAKALWPLFETIINSIQSLEDSCIDDKEIVINALRQEETQLVSDEHGNVNDEPARFESFTVTDNGNGFNKRNYTSFLEAYSQLKVTKGCKGIGRFLWLKAFDNVDIKSTYLEDEQWHCRTFKFSVNGIAPEHNDLIITQNTAACETIVSLNGFKVQYRDAVAYSLESLAKKIIEHCLPYFITAKCPKITLQDNRGEKIGLNDYYEKRYNDSLQRDQMELHEKKYTLYHMHLNEGADKNELHFCANNREVKSYPLSNYIPDMKKKLVNSNGSYYYVGYLTGEYLDCAVNTERSDFVFSDAPLFGGAQESEIVQEAVKYIKIHLNDDLIKLSEEKKSQIDMFVEAKKPQYRLLLNRRPDVYDCIPAGLSEDKLDIELYKHQQKWELDTAKKKHDIEEKVKQDVTSDISFNDLFDDYCENITELSRASLAEYVIRRKAVIDLLERALEADDKGRYSKESSIHRIICPMQTTSNEIKFDDMNLWLIDDRLSYHHFLASDKRINTIPVLENNTDKRMDLAIFDAALSYTADPDHINSITIIELKRPQRNDFTTDETDPITQVYDYVADIKGGKVKKANGRGFANVENVAFYCYVIADITPSLKKSAARAGLFQSQDREGYFGYNQNVGTYIEIISYDKLLKDAKQRNTALFDMLFEPKSKNLAHPEYIGK